MDNLRKGIDNIFKALGQKDRTVSNRTKDRLHQRLYNTPLDEFKAYENQVYTGPDFFNTRHYFGIDKGFNNPHNRGYSYYPDLITNYSKSKGKFAKQFNDPEIQKYFNDRMNYRKNLYDRVRKVPQDKWDDFTNEYGPFADPFDYEKEFASQYPVSVDEFLKGFDYSANDWETLDDYLKKWGY